MSLNSRLFDFHSGHDSCPPMPLMTASYDTFDNCLPNARLLDLYFGHGCEDHEYHNDFLVTGKLNTFIDCLPCSTLLDITNWLAFSVEGSLDTVTMV